ncbi:MAG TPA: DUF4349 domain-containing protein [Nocardioides sp.]
MTTRTRTWRRALAGLALALTTTTSAVACSGGVGGADAGGASEGEVMTSSESAAGDMAQDMARGAPGEGAGRSVARADAVAARPGAAEPGLAEKVVSRGTVALEADDVAVARAEVQRVTDSHGGQVAESQTETDSDGTVTHSRMVLRVPVDEFDTAMDELEQVADLRSSDQDSDVVTAQYADLEARVRAQEASLRRVELLFSRAQSIRDIVAIEAQLTARQADLDSLTGQLRVLEDRTALSTITVHLMAPYPEPVEEDEAGFLAGLAAGWDALKELGTGLATVSGVLLPFVVLVALLGLPLAVVVRRLRRRPAPPAAAAGEVG